MCHRCQPAGAVGWRSVRCDLEHLNPSLAATASLRYTQPLPRGFRTDNERTQLVVSRIDRDIADIDLEETIVNTLADVRLAYWELVHAHAAADVQRQSLALAEQLVRDNRARAEIGMVGRSRSCRRGPKRRCGGSRWQRRFACCEPTSWPSSSTACCACRCQRDRRRRPVDRRGVFFTSHGDYAIHWGYVTRRARQRYSSCPLSERGTRAALAALTCI